jgi:hypothetical protein
MPVPAYLILKAGKKALVETPLCAIAFLLRSAFGGIKRGYIADDCRNLQLQFGDLPESAQT